MNMQRNVLLSAMIAISTCALGLAQTPGGARAGGPRRAALSVTTTAFPDGGEIPMKYAAGGENKSPAFEFHWNMGVNPASAPETLVSYAVILHDIENANNKTSVDTLHWSAFNIPGTATGIAEGLGAGDLPDGTRNGPGLGTRNGHAPVYWGPGAGPGPFHHYVFEFYALDTKLDLPANTTRDEILKAMDGHIVGKAVWVGRFHAQP